MSIFGCHFSAPISLLKYALKYADVSEILGYSLTKRHSTKFLQVITAFPDRLSGYNAFSKKLPG